MVFAGPETLRPGEPGVLEVSVTNVGTTVEGYDLVVLGELAPFATIAPAEVRLLPGQQETVTVVVVVTSELPAGPVAFGVKVQPRTAPEEAVVEERELQVAPVSELSLRAVPMVLRTRRRGEARVEVENTGNAPVTADLSVTDPNEELSASLRPAQLTVDPHSVATSRLNLRSLAPAGASIGYTIRARTPDGQERQVDARMETRRRRLLPWAVAAVVLLLLGIVASNQLRGNNAKVIAVSNADATSVPDASTTSVPDGATTTTATGPATTAAGDPAQDPASDPGTTLGPNPGSTTPTQPGASTTRVIPKPPPPTTTSTTAPPPCLPPCTTVARSSVDNRIVDTGGAVTVVSISQPPRNGTATIRDGGRTVYYTPNRGYVGLDQITYQVSDGAGGTASGVMRISVR